MGRPSSAEKMVIALAHGIAEGRWPPGKPLPSIRRLAKELELSVPTAIKVVHLAVQRGMVALRSGKPAMVLANAPHVAAELLRQVPLPPALAREDESHKTRIALLYPEKDHPLRFAPHVALARHLALAGDRAGLRFEPVAWPMKDQVPFALSLPARGFRAAALLGMHSFYRVGLAALLDQRFPAVLINRRHSCSGVPAVAGDDYKPARDLALRLIRLGHRNLSLVCEVLPTIDMQPHDALRGWIDGLAEGGVLDECPMPVHILPNFENLRKCPRTFNELLLRPDRPTALFFLFPDWMEIILNDPRFARFRVPEDISLIVSGPGERPPVLSNGSPISALDLDYQRLADCVTQNLIDLIAGRPCPQLLLLPHKLQLTDSIGPPPEAP